MNKPLLLYFNEQGIELTREGNIETLLSKCSKKFNISLQRLRLVEYNREKLFAKLVENKVK
jgi:hypothetical protein